MFYTAQQDTPTSTFSMQSLEETSWEEVSKLYQPVLVIYSATHPEEHKNIPTGRLSSSPSYCWYLFDGCDGDHEEERKAAGYRAGRGVHYHLQTVRADWWQPASGSRISKNSGHGCRTVLGMLGENQGREKGWGRSSIYMWRARCPHFSLKIRKKKHFSSLAVKCRHSQTPNHEQLWTGGQHQSSWTTDTEMLEVTRTSLTYQGNTLWNGIQTSK